MYAVMNISLLFFFYKICHWTYFSKSSSLTELLDCIVSDCSDKDDFLSLFDLLNLFNFFSFIFDWFYSFSSSSLASSSFAFITVASAVVLILLMSSNLSDNQSQSWKKLKFSKKRRVQSLSLQQLFYSLQQSIKLFQLCSLKMY